jgi:hypothetical protein
MADPDLTDEQRRELDRRLADIDENPDDEFTWEEVKTEARRDDPIGEPFELTDDVKRMLDERIAAHKANPDGGVPFEDVVREARARWGR